LNPFERSNATGLADAMTANSKMIGIAKCFIVISPYKSKMVLMTVPFEVHEDDGRTIGAS